MLDAERGRAARRATRASEERSSTLRSGRTSRREVVNGRMCRSPEDVDLHLRWGSRPENDATGRSEARLRAVKRVRAGAGLPQGGPASRGRSRVKPAKHSAIDGGASHGARKSSEPSGARVVGRLQRSVTSTFPPQPRGAARQTEDEVDNTLRRASVTGGIDRVG